MKFTLSLHLQQLKMHLQMISTFSFLNHIIGILRASNINVFFYFTSIFNRVCCEETLCEILFYFGAIMKDYYTKNYNNSSIHSSTFQYFSHIVR